MCEYSENIIRLSGYEQIIGNSVSTSGGNIGLFGPHIIQSQGGTINIRQILSRGSFQPYTVTFSMLYSSAFRNSGQIIQVIVGGQSFNFSSQTLPLFAATNLPGISGLTTNIYQSQMSYTVNSSDNIDSSLNSEYASLQIVTNSNLNRQ